MISFDAKALEDIRTRFVRDRLEETSFVDRQWIAGLIHWERSTALGGPLGWASNMFYAQFQQAHPVECRCMTEELRTGRYTDPPTYRQLLAEHTAERRRQREARFAADTARVDAERDAWRRAGGRP